RIAAELVDAPDETGAVEPAGQLEAERRLWLLARAAPDVRIADQLDRRLEHGQPPAAQGRGREAIREGASPRHLPALVAEDLRGGIGGLGARRRLRRQQLERVLRDRVVDPQAE